MRKTRFLIDDDHRSIGCEDGLCDLRFECAYFPPYLDERDTVRLQTLVIYCFEFSICSLIGVIIRDDHDIGVRDSIFLYIVDDFCHIGRTPEVGAIEIVATRIDIEVIAIDIEGYSIIFPDIDE